LRFVFFKLFEFMKPILYAILFSGVYLSAQALFAQNVGIGTSTPNASAKLEIVDANRGFLFPRVSLTATNVAAPVTAPANWLVVFNVATAGAGATAVSPGLYYWDNTFLRWVRIQNETDAWRTLGNAGTSPATNFIGTTDAQDFVFRTSNTERMRLTSAGRLVMNATVARARLHVEENFLGSFSAGLPIPGMIVNNGDDMVGMTVVDRDGVSGGDDSDGMIYWGDNLGTDNLHFSFLEWGGGVLTRRDRMIIQSTGNVGIGTTTPADRLDVNGGGWLRSTTNPFYVMSNPSTAANGGLIHTQIGANTAGTWGFKQYTLSTGLAQNQTSFNLGLVNMGTPNTMFLDKMLVVQGTGQVAMGAAVTDLNAQLDVVSTSRGVLLPRVALTQTTSFAPLASSPSTSLLVYNTATINDVSPGFYYWNGTNWVRFQTSNTNNWTLLGNAGTNPATNFIGTRARFGHTHQQRRKNAGNGWRLGWDRY
jgi:trimeric autotransporter adhesin